MIDFDDKRPEATARRSFKSLTATARTFLARRPGVVCVFLSSAHGLAVQKRIEMPLGAHTRTYWHKELRVRRGSRSPREGSLWRGDISGVTMGWAGWAKVQGTPEFQAKKI